MSDLLPLVKINEIESERDFGEIDSPEEAINYIVSRLAVSPQFILNSFPVKVERGGNVTGDKVTFNRDDCSIRFGGCVIGAYPAHVPVMFVGGEKPDYMRELEASEVSSYGLADPSGKNFIWIIYEPA